MTSAPDIGGSPGLRPLDRFAASLVAVSFGVSQPLLDLLGRNAAFFGARSAPVSDIVGTGVLVALAVPLGIALCALFPGRAGHLAFFLGTGFGLFAFAVRLPGLLGADSDAVWAVVGIVAVIGGMWLLEYTASARSFARFLLVAPFVSLAVFLVASPTSRTLRAPSVDLPRVAAPGDPAPVVVVVFDELPLASLVTVGGGIRVDWFPNFDRLADDAVWYRNAATTQQQTDRALPTILTGIDAPPDRQPVLADHPANLFTLLGPHYQLRVIEGLTSLCPDDCVELIEPDDFVTRWSQLLPDLWVAGSHQLLPPGIRSRLPSIQQQWGGFGDMRFRDLMRNDRRSIAEAFTRDIAVEGRTDHPTLHFLHVLLPHLPWQHLPDGRVLADPSQDPPGLIDRRWIDDWAADLAMQRHLLSVQFTDTVLGEILDGLESAGIYDEALVVVMADHGVSIEPSTGYLREVRDDNIGQIGAIPLFVKLPGGVSAGTIDDYRAELPDVLPTIADALSIEIPWELDGVSLLADRRPDRLSTRASGVGNFATWGVTGSEKYEVAARIDALFPTGDVMTLVRPDDMVWLGTRPSQGTDCADCVLDQPDLFASVSLESEVVPAVVKGRITSEEAPGRRVGVAANGVIEAVTYSFLNGEGQLELQAIVRPGALVEGENSITFVLLD